MVLVGVLSCFLTALVLEITETGAASLRFGDFSHIAHLAGFVFGAFVAAVSSVRR